MVLKELKVNSRYCDYDDIIEARFALNKDEFYLINDYNNTIYSLGIAKIKDETKRVNNMKKNKTRVIFNNPATILYMNGKRYISKAHEEDFDEEKGLLMCLAKANGISHLGLKRMIKGAKRQTKTAESEVKDDSI